MGCKGAPGNQEQHHPLSLLLIVTLRKMHTDEAPTDLQLHAGWEGRWQIVGTAPGLRQTRHSMPVRAHGWAAGPVQGMVFSLAQSCTCDEAWYAHAVDTSTAGKEVMWCRYEGPDCDVDINECVRATAGCSGHAGCINVKGSYKCTCHYGFSGTPIKTEAQL